MIGSLGKAKVVARFIESGFYVFVEFDGKNPFDLVVCDSESRLYKVEVKTTSSRTKYDTGWAVQIKAVRPNRSGNKIIPFDKSLIDLLAIYIEPEDRVVIVDAQQISVRNELVLKDGEYPNWLRNPV